MERRYRILVAYGNGDDEITEVFIDGRRFTADELADMIPKPMTDDDLKRAIQKARKIAAPVGPLHAAWDAIMDAEAHLCGRQAQMSRLAVENALRPYLGV